MAQDGDTITYTYSDGSSVSEDVSAVSEAVVEYCNGPGGSNQNTTGGAGGRVENATIDVSSQDTLYLWVGGSSADGRYIPAGFFFGGGSSEISFSNTDQDDSNNEPFLVGAGGGGSGYGSSFAGSGSEGGARGGLNASGSAVSGTAPPKGGDGADNDSDTGDSGDGAIDDQNRGLVSGGTTIKGGGGGAATDGEIQITYQSGPEPPAAPTGLTASIN